MKEKLKEILKSFNTQEGRFNRFNFWVYPIIITIISIMIILLLSLIVTLINITIISNFYNIIEPIILLLGMLYILFTTVIKRLHDLNKKGWWSLLLFIPFLGFILIIYTGFFKGTKGANKYGADPLEK